MGVIREGASLDLLGVLLWIVPAMALGAWTFQAQKEYLEHYRAVRGVNLPLPGERRFGPDPSLTGAYWEAVRQPQPEFELEQDRRRVVHRWWLTVAYGCFGVALPALCR